MLKLVTIIILISLLLVVQHGQTAQNQPQARQPQAPPSSSAPASDNGKQQMSAQQEQSFFNLKSLFSGAPKTPFGDRKCLMCRFSVSLINYALKTRRGYDQVDKIANTFCTAAHLESASVCSQVSKLFNHEITKVLTYGIMTPDQVCGLLSNNTCGHFHSPLDDWEINLEASNHLDKTQAVVDKKTREATGAAPAYRVIHISDTHVDTKYKVGAPVQCQEPLCCQTTSTPLNGTLAGAQTAAEGGQSKAGYWGSYGSCDIPLRTFEATLKFIDSLMKESKDIEYIIWTGDIQPHDVWTQNKKSATQLYDTVFAKIFKYLPRVKILPTLGNHEMIPVDSFSPSNLIDIARDDSPVWLYKKLDAFWSRWLPKDTVSTITKDGFYSTTIKPGLKVVSLNTNFCHSKNFWLFINSTDPGNQLQWLVHELHLSELIEEKVHIIGHIPPGSEDCMKVWSKNYNRIVRRYWNTITGQFFGHTHYNEFEMFYEPVPTPKSINEVPVPSAQPPPPVVTSLAMLNTSALSNTSESSSFLAAAASTTASKNITLKPIGVGFVGPSVTTFINLNPSFRVYTIDPKREFMPTDFETYFMNLTTANMDVNQEPEWTSAGMFSKVFGLNDTSPESMHELLTDIASDFGDVEVEEVEEGDNTTSADSTTNDTSLTTTTVAPSSSTTVGSNNNTKTDNETADEEGEEEEEDSDDRLFELYWMYNSYADSFNRSTYDSIPIEDKKKFLCRLFTGQSHDSLACDEFLPAVTLFKVASDLVEA